MSKTSTKFKNHRNDTNIPLTSVFKLIVRPREGNLDLGKYKTSKKH